MAIKLIQYGHEDDIREAGEVRRELDREVRHQSLLEHERIVKILDYEPMTTLPGVRRKIGAIVTELVQRGTLNDYLGAGRISESVTRFYAKQLLSALSHMHSRGVCHLDLKPANILIDWSFGLKVADFGLSSLI